MSGCSKVPELYSKEFRRWTNVLLNFTIFEGGCGRPKRETAATSKSETGIHRSNRC
jgi:hypothetical protein